MSLGVPLMMEDTRVEAHALMRAAGTMQELQKSRARVRELGKLEPGVDEIEFKNVLNHYIEVEMASISPEASLPRLAAPLHLLLDSAGRERLSAGGWSERHAVVSLFWLSVFPQVASGRARFTPVTPQSREPSRQRPAAADLVCAHCGCARPSMQASDQAASFTALYLLPPQKSCKQADLQLVGGYAVFLLIHCHFNFNGWAPPANPSSRPIASWPAAPRPQRCSGCLAVLYCSAQCLKAAWPDHR